MVSVTMKAVFTDKYLKGIKSSDKKYTITESTGERGESRLQLNVYPTGVKKYQIQYFLAGKRRRMEFGKFGPLLGDYSLRQARIEFSNLADMVKRNVDPKYPDKINTPSGLESLKHLHDAFTSWYKANRKVNSYNTIFSYLRTDFVTGIDQNLPANTFTTDDARRMVYSAWNRGSKGSALGLKSALSKMFKFGLEYDNGPERFGQPPIYGLKTNPIMNMPLSYKKEAGQRWLSEEEIRRLWHGENMHPKLHNYIKLALALAGQRIEELSLANASEFDIENKVFAVPVARVKISGRGDHVVPLGELAINTYYDCLKFRSINGALFPMTRDNSKGIPAASLRRMLNTWFKRNPKFEKFVLRDLRRTCKTHMSKAGVPITHRDMLQQHYKNDVATVHYDRHDYLKEKREAIEIWDNYLKQIVE
jgi:integrase